jgi:hypothetical protein
LLGYDDETINWTKDVDSIQISTKLKKWMPNLKWGWVFEFMNVTIN